MSPAIPLSAPVFSSNEQGRAPNPAFWLVAGAGDDIAWLGVSPGRGSVRGLPNTVLRVLVSGTGSPEQMPVKKGALLVAFDVSAAEAIAVHCGLRVRPIGLSECFEGGLNNGLMRTSLSAVAGYFGLPVGQDALGQCEAMQGVITWAPGLLSKMLGRSQGDWSSISFMVDGDVLPPEYRLGKSGRAYRVLPRSELVAELQRLEALNVVITGLLVAGRIALEDRFNDAVF